MKKINMTALVAASLTASLWTSAALAQSSAIGGFEAGYGNRRALESEPINPSTRDANGNRVVMNGLIQDGSGGNAVVTDSTKTAAGASFFQSGASSATASAIGNMVNISVSGSWNTVVLNSTQINNGAVSATAVLNEKVTQSTGQ
ncbi:holdfast anchoring protein HfaA [Bradyrhizobium canariense]|uniref:holdfast anchoring protein HfaA n=1 Tax=Bradyrhizobium canariense TaxID=255045 RepID=UPI000A18C355|nr:holdfast anchoring protein HfaA [Bradyrhizobium canariense]OSI85057.1 hypothetical protein BSZ23_00520 [Bradyrhizobium canariense]